jgi:hypothetical protein
MEVRKNVTEVRKNVTEVRKTSGKVPGDFVQLPYYAENIIFTTIKQKKNEKD